MYRQFVLTTPIPTYRNCGNLLKQSSFIYNLLCILAVDYMKALAEGSSEDVRYLRVMLIGPSGVGKTSLLDRMMGEEPASKASSTKMAVTHHLWAKAKRGKHWKKVTEEDEIVEIAKLFKKANINEQKSKSNDDSQVNKDKNQPMSPVASNHEVQSSHSSQTSPDSQSISEVSGLKSKVPEDSAVDDTANATEIQTESVKPTGKVIPNERESEFEKKIKSMLGDENVTSILVRAYKQVDQVEIGEEEKETYLHVWDCGGQLVYLNALPPFLSAATAFLLVFNATKDMDDPVELIWNDNGEQIEHAKLSISYTDLFTFWMAAIDSYVPRKLEMLEKEPSPRVIMVGTHSKASEQDEHRKHFDSFFEEKFDGATYYKRMVKCTKVVENKDKTGDFSKIHKCVMDFADDFTMKTPVKWVLFRKILNRVAESEPIVSLDTAISIGKVCNIEEEEEVRSVLDFYHELGVFLFYPEMGNKCIIASPKWLVENLGCLLCHEKQLKKVCKDHNAVKLFCKNGVLIKDLYQDVFEKHEDMQNINLVDVLTSFSLAAKVIIKLHGSTYEGKEGYFVPTMLSQSQNDRKLPVDYYLSSGPLCLRIPSHNYLPPGFFVQMLVALTKNDHFVVDSSTAGYNAVSYIYQSESDFVVSVSAKSNTHVEVTLHREIGRDKTEPYFCSTCQDVLKAILSAAEEIPLKKLLKDFRVQPALAPRDDTPLLPLSPCQQHKFVDIKKDKDNKKCYRDGRIDPKAKLWLAFNEV